MSLLTLTTLPYLLALPYVNDKYYSALIVGQTSSSILMHTFPSDFFYFIDYAFVIAWYMYDMDLSFESDSAVYVCQLYISVFLFHMVTELASYHGLASYDVLHSLFHLVSAGRAIHLAAFLHKN